jgi:hypothetical protein
MEIAVQRIYWENFEIVDRTGYRFSLLVAGAVR